MNRPVGIVIITVLQVIGSIVGILASLVIFFFQGLFVQYLSENPELQEPGQEVPVEVFGWIAIAIGIIVLVFSLIGLLLAWGLWMLKSWAWLLTLLLQGLGLVGNVLSLLSGAVGALVSIAISAVIIYYLTRPEVRRAFGR